jgi:hypothetical protein
MEIKRISVFPDIYLEIGPNGGMKIIKSEEKGSGTYIPPKEINLDSEASRGIYNQYKKYLMEEKLKKEEGD